EFERDWNIQGVVLEGNEYLINAVTGISKSNKFLFNYELDSYIKGHDYRGIRNGYNLRFNNNGYKIESRGSYLTAEAQGSSEFLRHYTTIEKKMGEFTLGAYTEQERILFYEPIEDTLTNVSKDRVNYRVYLETL